MTNDPGAITIRRPLWEGRETGKTCAYIPRYFDAATGLKVYRTLRLAQRARVYQIAAHALGLAPPVRSTIVEVRVQGQTRKRWGYLTAHAERVGEIPPGAIRRLIDRAHKLGIPAFDDHEHNFGFHGGSWKLIDFAHPDD